MKVLRPPHTGWAASPLRRAALALVCAAALLAPVAPAAAVTDEQVESSSEVEAARERRQAEDEQLRQLFAELDQAAGAYEIANKHHLLLLEEGRASDGTVADALESLRRTEAGFAEQAAQAYRRPDRQIRLAEAVLLSPDVAGALHQAAMVEHVAARRADRVDAAQRQTTYITGLSTQREIVTAGVAGAAEDLQHRAEDLTFAVEQGKSRLAQADAALTQVRSEVREKIEEEERLEAWRKRAAEIAAGAAPPVVVDGKVCPVGAPNGFIDSWGFPRSGGRVHKGVDMFAAYGTPLYATADGVIDRVWTNRLGGLSINLIDGNGDRYYYAHLSAASAAAGQRVRAGDVIGAVGDSGNARGTPPHLHWQFHPGNGAPVNPYPLAVALCRA